MWVGGLCCGVLYLFSSRRRHTRCALVTGVQTCALPISLSLAKADNRLVYASDLMSWQVVEYHDVAALERRGEHMLDVGSEGVAIHGAAIGRASCRDRVCQYV